MGKKEDINGYWEYTGIPITRTCVAPYKGKSIDSDGSMGLDPNKKYMVYRPAAEVTNPRFLETMEGVFLTRGHEMLGKGQRDPGTKSIAGTVYNVRVDPNDPTVVLADIKVQSEAEKKLIDRGVKALSCGYYCDYKPQKGTFNGQPYDFVQVDLIGNHLALVPKGRMGDKCALDSADGDTLAAYALDSATLTELMQEEFAKNGCMESQVRGGNGKKATCDSAIDINQKEVKFMPNDYDAMLAQALQGKGVMEKEKIDKIINFINTELTDANPAPAAKDSDPNAQPPADTNAQPPADQNGNPAPVAKDSDPNAQAPADTNNNPTPTTVTREEFQDAVDAEVEAALPAAIEARFKKEDEGRELGEMAADIAPSCKGLWKRGMDADDVAAAACEQLGHKDLPKEARIPFVKAMAAEAKKAPVAAPKGSGMDASFETPTPTGPSTFMAKYYATK
mgnify:CR=1 FL=1